jgi:hypothetical protein
MNQNQGLSLAVDHIVHFEAVYGSVSGLDFVGHSGSFRDVVRLFIRPPASARRGTA